MRKEIKDEIRKKLKENEMDYMKLDIYYHVYIRHSKNNISHSNTYCDTLNKLYMFINDNDLEHIKNKLSGE